MKLEVAKLAEHPAYTRGWVAAWKSMKEEVTEARKEIEKVKGRVVETKKEIEELGEEMITTVNTLIDVLEKDRKILGRLCQAVGRWESEEKEGKGP